MSSSYEPPNPYSASPTGWSNQPTSNDAELRERVRTKVMIPAIFLIIIGVLGLLASIFSCVNAAISDPPPVDPNAPEMVNAFAQGSVGPVAVGIQAFFILFNAFIIFGAVQMLRMKAWPLALSSSIAAIINFGSCCCIFGIPVGIWSIVILSTADVKDAFKANA